MANSEASPLELLLKKASVSPTFPSFPLPTYHLLRDTLCSHEAETYVYEKMPSQMHPEDGHDNTMRNTYTSFSRSSSRSRFSFSSSGWSGSRDLISAIAASSTSLKYLVTKLVCRVGGGAKRWRYGA